MWINASKQIMHIQNGSYEQLLSFHFVKMWKLSLYKCGAQALGRLIHAVNRRRSIIAKVKEEASQYRNSSTTTRNPKVGSI